MARPRAGGRNLRKRKAAPVVKKEESDSGDSGSDDDGEFKVDVNVKSDDDDENLSDDDDVATKNKNKSPGRKKNPTPTAIMTTPKTKSSSKKTLDEKKEEYEEGDRPIPTLNGGYSHTKKSRKKIGLANKGNTPWNKGRIRSEEDKAKISAGVKARNRIVLLAKLEKLGMTEEEWYAQKKKTKLTREIDRRKRVKEKEQLKKEAALNARTPEDIEAEQTQKEEAIQTRLDEKERREKEKKLKVLKERQERLEAAGKDQPKKSKLSKPSVALRTKVEIAIKKTNLPAKPKALRKEISWKEHLFDQQNGSYSKCPIGGPGGLICCASCCASYNQYMNFTCTDFEDQTINIVSNEYSDIIDELKIMNAKFHNSLTM